MPSKTAKQARTMAACAHGAELGVCKDIPMKVAKEFNAADKGTKLLSRSAKRPYDKRMNAQAMCVGGPVNKTRW